MSECHLECLKLVLVCVDRGADAPKPFVFKLLVRFDSVERPLVVRVQFAQLLLEGAEAIFLLPLERTDSGRELVNCVLLAVQRRQCLIEAAIHLGNSRAL
jgi:hypothetical protein